MTRFELIHNGALLDTYDTLPEAKEDFDAMVQDMPHNYKLEQSCRPFVSSMDDYEETLEVMDEEGETFEFASYTRGDWDADCAQWEREERIEERQREFGRALDIETLKSLFDDLNTTTVAWRVYFDAAESKVFAREFDTLNSWVDYDDEDVVEFYQQDTVVLDDDEALFGSISALQDTLEQAFEVANV